MNRETAALYLRVSTTEQDTANQRHELEGFAERKGYSIVEVYEDVATGNDPGRNAFNRMIHDARLRRWDVLLFWSWDRMTRKGIDSLFAIMRKLEIAGVEWESIEEPFLSSVAPAYIREVLASIVAFVAKQERELISRRTKAAIARRRALGHPWGRPPGSKDKRPRKSPRRKGTFDHDL